MLCTPNYDLYPGLEKGKMLDDGLWSAMQLLTRVRGVEIGTRNFQIYWLAVPGMHIPKRSVSVCNIGDACGPNALLSRQINPQLNQSGCIKAPLPSMRFRTAILDCFNKVTRREIGVKKYGS